MKIQVLFSLLPFLAGLAAAAPAPAGSTTLATTTAPAALTTTGTAAAAATSLTPGEDSPAALAEDEESESFEESGPVEEFDKRASAAPARLSWNTNFDFWSGRIFRRHIGEGDSTITVYSNGNVFWRTHFKALRHLSYNYAVTCGVSDKQGNVYTLTRKGRICGSLGSCPRSHDVSQTKFNAMVRDNWTHIKAGNKKMICKAQLKWSLVGLFDNVLDAIKRLIPIVKTVIKIFTA